MLHSKLVDLLRDRLNITESKDLARPITRDPAYALNLAAIGVRDARNTSGKLFRHFIKRCNVFNHVLANGKGFALLEIVDSNAREPVLYALQRFASSSCYQWIKIEASHDSLWKALDLLNPNRDQEEEWQYMIGGSDFVEDLLALLDIMILLWNKCLMRNLSKLQYGN